MNLTRFFSELKRRNVYKVAVAYAMAGWVIAQIATQIFPFLEIPNWVVRLVIVIIAIGFPLALIIAWAFEATPEGIKRTEDADSGGAARAPKKHAWIYIVIIGAAISAALFFLGRYTAGNKAANANESSAKSIAVLPFENLSEEKSNAYFAEGIQDEILARLSKISDLKVISRTSTQKYKSAPSNLREIAQQLGVAHILEGSVQRSGNAVRVNVQLINALNDAHLWGEIYDRQLIDIFSVESEISKAIADKLRAKLTGAEQTAIAARPTDSTEAYQLYLKGRFFWNKRTGNDLKKALEYFSQAVAKDPKYALAYAGMADVYILLPRYSAGAPHDSLVKAAAAVRKALELDSTLGEAHTSMGSVLTHTFEFAEAEKEFIRAIELNPNYATAHQWYSDSVLAPTGRLIEALAEMKRALELDPLSPIINAELAITYVTLERYDEAAAQFRKTLDLEPDFYIAHEWLGNLLQNKGEYAEAIKEFEKAWQLGRDPYSLGCIAHAYAASGNIEESRKVLARLHDLSNERYVPEFAFAVVYLGLGHQDEALRWLEKCYDVGDGNLANALRSDPRLKPLHADPRFKELFERVFKSKGG